MPKRLVVFCDGTWKRDDDKTVSNVVKAMWALRTADSAGIPQIAFYDPGVGTETPSRRILGGAFGIGVSTNVKDAYRFLANNYASGDQIYLFGFSRGAFTVRSLAGFIGASGLLRKIELNRIDEAYGYYRTPPNERRDAQKTELARHCVDGAKIHFVGVWDTVGSLGIPVGALNWLFYSRFRFHDESLGSIIESAYHAVAIDERRGPFRASLWLTDNVREQQRVEQVWFAGVHSNIGGGYADSGLSNCALHWMIAKATREGLAFDSAYLARHEANADGELYDSRKGYYRLLAQKVRDVDWDGYANGAIHQSAWQRWNGRKPYNPDNLRRGLANLDVVDNAGNVIRAAAPL